MVIIQRAQTFSNAHNLMDLLINWLKGRERTRSEESVSGHGESGLLRSETLAKERESGWGHLIFQRRLLELMMLQHVRFGESNSLNCGGLSWEHEDNNPEITSVPPPIIEDLKSGILKESVPKKKLKNNSGAAFFVDKDAAMKLNDELSAFEPYMKFMPFHELSSDESFDAFLSNEMIQDGINFMDLWSFEDMPMSRNIF